MRTVRSRHVTARHDSLEGRQAASLLERSGIPSRRPRQWGAAGWRCICGGTAPRHIPGSAFADEPQGHALGQVALYRHWFATTALGGLLATDPRQSEIHKLHASHDRLLEHKDALFRDLQYRWRDLFNTDFDVLLYDLTST
jgi:hypothetical protein